MRRHPICYWFLSPARFNVAFLSHCTSCRSAGRSDQPSEFFTSTTRSWRIRKRRVRPSDVTDIGRRPRLLAVISMRLENNQRLVNSTVFFRGPRSRRESSRVLLLNCGLSLGYPSKGTIRFGLNPTAIVWPLLGLFYERPTWNKTDPTVTVLGWHRCK